MHAGPGQRGGGRAAMSSRPLPPDFAGKEKRTHPPFSESITTLAAPIMAYQQSVFDIKPNVLQYYLISKDIKIDKKQQLYSCVMKELSRASQVICICIKDGFRLDHLLTR